MEVANVMTPASRRAVAPPIRFAAVLDTIESQAAMRLPDEASTQLPSRGQVAVRGAIDGQEFRTVLEPGRPRRPLDEDRPGTTTGRRHGRRRHREAYRGGDEGLARAGRAARPGGSSGRCPATIQDVWKDITPMARWEWVRWVNATRNPATRQRRVDVSISKMSNGKRRPCCFDLSACTDPELSRNGKLLESS
jgi:hypothetical protein